MKKTFTPFQFLSKSGALLFLLIGLSISSNAQQTFNVTVSSFQFSPSSLTINVGDQVTWTNVDGSHNVNGSLTGNPVNFGNNVGSGWVYSFTFNVPGTYNYHCDPHSGFMQGTIQVVSPSGIENAGVPLLSVYPNPASDRIQLSIDSQRYTITDVMMLDIHTINGQLTAQIPVHFEAKSSTTVDISFLESGVYIYTLRSDAEDPKRGKFIVQ